MSDCKPCQGGDHDFIGPDGTTRQCNCCQAPNPKFVGEPAEPRRKPRVLVDFDGVIHCYSKGWHDGSIYDPPIPGAFKALEALMTAGYEVVIFSTRDASQIRVWLDDRKWPTTDFPQVTITNEKLPAVALIDDRAIHFTDWASASAELQARYPVR